MNTDKNSIFNKDNLLRYGLYTNVKFHKEIKVKDTEYVILIDKYGNSKKVYKDLFEKYAKVMK